MHPAHVEADDHAATAIARHKAAGDVGATAERKSLGSETKNAPPGGSSPEREGNQAATQAPVKLSAVADGAAATAIPQLDGQELKTRNRHEQT